MEIFQIALVSLLTFGSLIYFLIKKRQKYWLRYNVPTEQDSFFFVGRKEHVATYLQKIYNRFRDSGHPFVGCFIAFSPAALLLDLDLIKRVLISDFNSFSDRGSYHNIKDDPLSSNLTRLQGENWRRLRSKLTPTFTSGKIKYMFPTKVTVAYRLIETIENAMKCGKTELDMRDLCARFTTDIIGSVAFGIDCNSLANPNAEFRVCGEKAFQCFRPIVETIGAANLKFFNRIHVTAFSQDLIQFYTKIVRETIEMRQKQKIRRNDFLDIIIELSETKTDDGEPMLTLREIIGQAFIFFIAGYETSSSTMTYCLYELSKNQDIQEKARAEVLNTLQRFNGELSYECIKDMHYLRQVIDETLRKHPVAPLLRRVVRKRYLIPDTSISLEEGMVIVIPVSAIHHDALYYPEPEKFKPERFSPEEVQKRHPMCYLPFGAGPRVCIAERFAKMEVQLGIAILLQNFRLSPSEKTPKHLKYDISEKRFFKVNSLFLNVEKL